ncbi:MAG: hypothetical protein ABI333_08070 [bacterium]
MARRPIARSAPARPLRLLLLLLVAGCQGSAGRSTSVRPSGAPEETVSEGLAALAEVEQRLRLHPGDRSAWKRLRRLAQQTQRRARELIALEQADARDRLPAALRPRLAGLLRRRAQELWLLGAPAAAQVTLRRANALQRHPEGRWHQLQDRLTLALADRELRLDRPARALQSYRRLARRGVLAGEALAWRSAAAGESQKPSALAEGILRLGAAPVVASRLAGRYLALGGRSPRVLLAALRATAADPSLPLADQIDRLLSKVAPADLLSRACALRRRPTAPSCRTLERWATTDLTALRSWATLCRQLHWGTRDARWLTRVRQLLRTQAVLGLGPLEGLALPRPTWKRPQGGRPPADALRHAFEAWAAGDAAAASIHLSTAHPAPGSTTANPPEERSLARCELIRVTRLLGGHRAAWRLAARPADAELRSRLLERWLRQGALPAALRLATGAARQKAVNALRRFGRLLAVWDVLGHADTLRKTWQQRYGSAVEAAAWAEVQQGAKQRRVEPPVRAVARLAAMGRFGAALAQTARIRDVTARQRWRARLHLLGGKRASARRALLALLEHSVGGARHLALVMEELIRLGLTKPAVRLADALYEQSVQDPVLLRLVALAQLADGRLDKARLALVDWAAASPRPELAYLAGGRYLATRDRPAQAAIMASRALAWSGSRPLQVGLALLGYQLAAHRDREARETAAWLLGRWQKGRGRSGISQTLAAHLLARGQLAAAEPYLRLERGTRLPALFRAGRFQEVIRRARALSKTEPLAGRWPAIGALAELRLKNHRRAAQLFRDASRRTPRLEPLLDALAQADHGQIGAALVSLALALTGADRREAVAYRELATALAHRAGDRRRAAALLSDALTQDRWAGVERTGWNRLQQLIRGRRLPPATPWAILLAAQSDSGSCSR